MSLARCLSPIVAGSVALALVACGEPAGTTATHRLPAASPSSALVECPNGTEVRTSAVIDALGGVVSLGGNSVLFPLNALASPTSVELTVPASRFVEIDLSVNGGQGITFPTPVTVTIDYSRCSRNDLLTKPLHVWHIDEQTKALLEDMGGVDDKLNHRITFTTTHFSGYAVAN